MKEILKETIDLYLRTRMLKKIHREQKKMMRYKTRYEKQHEILGRLISEYVDRFSFLVKNHVKEGVK